MKIKSLLTMMFVLCACAACNDDKNEETPLNQVVAGKYEDTPKLWRNTSPQDNMLTNKASH